VLFKDKNMLIKRDTYLSNLTLKAMWEMKYASAILVGESQGKILSWQIDLCLFKNDSSTSSYKRKLFNTTCKHQVRMWY
jgi:hypothetical protein